jgi:hypothetical protein
VCRSPPTNPPGGGRIDDAAAFDRWLPPARAAVLLLAFLSIALFAAGVPFRVEELRAFDFAARSQSDIARTLDPARVQLALELLHPSPTFFARVYVALEIVFALTFVLIAALVARHRASPWWSLSMALMLALFGTAVVPTMMALMPSYPFLDRPISVINALGWTLLEVFLLLFLFPTGRFVPTWAKYPSAAWAFWSISWSAFPSLPTNPLFWPPALAFGLSIGWFAVGMASKVYRYRVISGPEERRRARWVLLGLAVAIVVGIIVNAPNVLWPGSQPTSQGAALYASLRLPATLVAVLPFPISIGIAILRYRLLDVDVIINRTLVWGAVTLLLSLADIRSVLLLQQILAPITDGSNLAVAMATLLVAAIFQPLRSTA